MHPQIEQYTLASALAELSSAAITPGLLRAGAAPSLSEMAAAHHHQQVTEAGAAGGDASSGSEGAGGGAEAAPVEAAPSSDGGAQRTASDASSPASIKHLDLSHPSGSFNAGGAGGSTPTMSRAPSRTHRVPVQAALVVDVPRPLPEKARGLLGWLGLSSGTPLRVTPGTAVQYGLLVFRSGERGGCTGAGRVGRGGTAGDASCQTSYPLGQSPLPTRVACCSEANPCRPPPLSPSPPAAGIKWARNWPSKMLELLLLMFAAVVCGEGFEPGVR